MLQFARKAILAAVFALTLAAADVDGTWKAVYNSPDGAQRESTFHLKAEGSKVTGKLASAFGDADIKNGKIEGDDLTFTVLRNFGGNEVEVAYKGKVAKDEIKFQVSFGERTMDITAKKQ